MDAHVQSFVETGTLVLSAWIEKKNQIAKQNKVMKENECALVTLENNIDCNDALVNIKAIVNDFKEGIVKDVISFKKQDYQINRIKTDCANSIKVLLRFYDKLNKTLFNEEDAPKSEEDPIGVEASKAFWSDIDNHQLRPEPPIAGVYKNAYHRHGVLVESASSNDAHWGPFDCT